MGFWHGLGNILGGRPVFDESRDDMAQLRHEESPHDTKDHKTSFVDEHGNKIVPEVSFKHFKSHVDGSRVKTWAWAVNDSPFELELVKTELLGHHQAIHRRLKPGESHEVMVYVGQVISHEHDHHAHLYYKIHENDDLFLAEYTIEFHRESNGTFMIEEFHRTYKPRDI